MSHLSIVKWLRSVRITEKFWKKKNLTLSNHRFYSNSFSYKFENGFNREYSTVLQCNRDVSFENNVNHKNHFSILSFRSHDERLRQRYYYAKGMDTSVFDISGMTGVCFSRLKKKKHRDLICKLIFNKIYQCDVWGGGGMIKMRSEYLIFYESIKHVNFHGEENNSRFSFYCYWIIIASW